MFLFYMDFFLLFCYNYIVMIMKTKNVKIILIVILLLVLSSLILLLIDKNSYKNYSRSYFYLDTYINIKVYTTKNEKEMNDIFNDIDSSNRLREFFILIFVIIMSTVAEALVQ